MIRIIYEILYNKPTSV